MSSRKTGKPLKARTSDEEFDGLWQAVHTARSTSKKVSVSKEALENLLMDHAALVDRDRYGIETPRSRADA